MKVENEKQIRVAEIKAKERDVNNEIKLLKRYGEALAQVITACLVSWF